MVKKPRSFSVAHWSLIATGLLLPNQLMAEHFFPCSPEQLKVAVIQANANCEDDVIDLQCNQFDLTTADNSTPVNGSNGLPVIGPDSGHELKIRNGIISRSNADDTPEFRFFEITPMATLILEEVTLKNGVVVTGSGLAISGGQILNRGRLVIKDSTFVGFIPDFTANPPAVMHGNASLGGGIYNDMGATVTIKRSTFSGLGALFGGAIYNVDSIPEICSSRFLTCEASTDFFASAAGPGVGGAIYNQAGASIGIIKESIFDRNQAPDFVGDGGAIYNSGISSPFATVDTISSTTFSTNSSFFGGAVSNQGTISTMSANLFANNSAGYGGGLFNIGNIGSISNSTFSENSAVAQGGGIANAARGTITYLTNNTIANNETTSFGGGIYSDGVVLNWISNLIANNTANSASFSGPDIFLGAFATVGTSTYNLIGNGSSERFPGSLCSTFVFADHNLVGFCSPFDLMAIDPLLESLADNGGPTLTMALRPLSPALDTGLNPSPHELKFDQRGPGYSRTIDGKTDIGAFESQP